MKILLTGSEGYIGKVLSQVLVDHHYDVTGLDTCFYADGWLYGKPFTLPTLLKKDIRGVTPKDLKGYDVLIHLAELSNDPLGQLDPELTISMNHEGTKHLIDCAVDAGIKRFIYSSSCSVYGASDEISDETSATHPITAYAKSKTLNEQYLLSLNSPGFTAVILRNSTVFGPSPRMRFDLAVNNLAGLAWTTGAVKMESNGKPWRPFVHILDASEAFRLSIDAPSPIIHNQILNVGSTSSNYQIRDIAQIIAREFGVKDISLNSASADTRNYRVNFDKIARILPGFTCTRTVETGASELRQMFESIQMTSDVFLSKEYTRMKMITYLQENNKLDQTLNWI